MRDIDLAAVKAELSTHTELTQSEEGCLKFEVIQDKDNANRFNVYEEFADRKSFLLHQDRIRKSKWGVVSAKVTRHYQVTGME